MGHCIFLIFLVWVDGPPFFEISFIMDKYSRREKFSRCEYCMNEELVTLTQSTWSSLRVILGNKVKRKGEHFLWCLMVYAPIIGQWLNILSDIV